MSIDLSSYIQDTKQNLHTVIGLVEQRGFDLQGLKNHIQKNDFSKYVLFVGGNQISGSLSPFMHTYSAVNQGYDMLYLLLDMDKKKLIVQQVLEFIVKHDDILGCNITMPYKIQGYEELKNNLNPGAMMAQSVNTVYKKDKNLQGINTDIQGFTIPVLEKLDKNLQDIETLYLLGAGGAARAVIVGALSLGIKNIKIYDRDKTYLTALQTIFQADEFKKLLHAQYNISDFSIQYHYYDVTDLNADYIDFGSPGILVNTLPFGFKQNLPKYPVKLDNINDFQNNIKLYFDVVYDINHKDTFLTSYIRQMYPDILLCDGMDMVISQAKGGFDIWTGGDMDLNKLKDMIKGNN